MAACQLVIKFDDDRARSGGEPITGTITVRAEKQVNCKGLTVRSIWSTHGRGNIDTGEVDKQTLYEGTWQAGQEYTYPFKLTTATWPPTYYGTYVSVAHYVAAQAKLSWATDPKAQLEFPVIATTAPEDLKPTSAPPKPTGIFGMLLVGIVVCIVLSAFIPLVLLMMVVVGPIALIVWLVKVVLPRRITGPVVCELKTPRTSAGSPVEANLTFTPRRSSRINGVEWTVSCIEECSSGSGSNRQTHRHQVLKETIRASDAIQLKAGEKKSFDLTFPIPTSAPPSLKFSDNHVKWSVAARIDIPSWPDWTKSLNVIVSAPQDASTLQRLRSAEQEDWDDEDEDDDAASGVLPPVITAGTASAEKTQADDAWFRQVIGQIQQSQHDADQLAMVIAAVRDFEFPITVSIENEIDTPEFEDENEFDDWDDAEWWSAFCPAQNISLALAWSHAPASIQAGATWSGTASIIGYEIEGQRILMSARRT